MKLIPSFFFFFFILLSINFISAQLVIGDDEGEPFPRVIIEQPPEQPANYSLVNVNNSLFWGGREDESDLDHNLLSGIDGGSTGEYYHLNQSVFQRVMNYVFQWLRPSSNEPYLYTENDQELRFNETKLNQTINELSDIQAYSVNTTVSVSSGEGTNLSITFFNYLITQIIVSPPSSTDTYRFEAREDSAGGALIDKDRKLHTGAWNIFKRYSINSSQVFLNISTASSDGNYNVEIKYIDNKIIA